MIDILIELIKWLLISILCAKFVLFLWDIIFLPIARRTPTKLDVMILEHTRIPIQWLVVTVVLNISSKIIIQKYPVIEKYYFWTVYRDVVYVSFVIFIAWSVYSFIQASLAWYAKRIISKDIKWIDQYAVNLISKIIKYLIVFVVITIVLAHFNIQITGLLATAGVISIVIGLAAQESLGNVIAGLTMLIDHPFKVGDRVELANGKMGDVLEIGLRSTKILGFDNTVLAVPNSEIARNQIININAPDPKFKIRASIGVAYGTDIRKTKKVILDILNAHPDILKEPPPAIYFTEFGESSLNLLYVCWISDYREQFRVRDEINMAIKDKFEDEHIEIPFPQRDIHIRSTV